jgi:hypothetical protein
VACGQFSSVSWMAWHRRRVLLMKSLKELLWSSVLWLGPVCCFWLFHTFSTPGQPWLPRGHACCPLSPESLALCEGLEQSKSQSSAVTGFLVRNQETSSAGIVSWVSNRELLIHKGLIQHSLLNQLQAFSAADPGAWGAPVWFPFCRRLYPLRWVPAGSSDPPLAESE